MGVKWSSVGVDLAGTPRKYTGLCRMRVDLSCESSLCKEDDEVIEFIVSSDPSVVAIDAPLNIPKPGQALRTCDRKLIEMNIHILPPTLHGMRILTDRAIKLKERLEVSGYKVIEVYPGGAQDVLKIPRKNKGLHLLKRGLAELGVKGLRCDETGHELDAITCSLVGIAYLEGKYIAVGDPEECIVILPRPETFLKKNNEVLHDGD
ncbi:MAG: DUF429 domain-containing protein [Nitrososphaerota archaeon]